MRAIVRLRPEAAAGALIPIQYNYLVQGLIYSSWNEKMAEFVHERGFPQEARRFRLFVFSRLSGTYQREAENLRFTETLTLQVASPVHALVEELAASWLRSGRVTLGESALGVEAIELRPIPNVGESVVVQTLSPVTVYETLHAADGRAKTYYYAPSEREFGILCGRNARRKSLALAGQSDDDAFASGEQLSLRVSPAGRRPHRQVILSYKGTVIKAWHGAFRLEGPGELIRLVLDAGLGSKNSQGFGMVDI